VESPIERFVSNLYAKIMRQHKRTDPRSVRGARRKGWHVVTLPANTLEKHNVSWLGIIIWVSRHVFCGCVNSYQTREFAFESEADASMFICKWVW